MRWGDPKTYAWLYRVSLTEEYRMELLRWIEERNPELCQLVRKEIAREKIPKALRFPSAQGPRE